MRITQGTFSFRPDLTDEQISRHVAYCQRNGWAVNVEFTDDPHPRNTLGDVGPADVRPQGPSCRDLRIEGMPESL
jgi:ribulose bisphosphate carboxylase small subunit